MSKNEDMEKAIYLVKEDKVAKISHPDLNLIDHYVVTGSKDDYLVILPNFCTCNHFQINCIREKGKVCKHILAAKLSGKNVRHLELDNWQNLLFRER